MIIFQFIYQQLSPAKFCGFLFKSYKANFKKALLTKFLQRKHAKISKKCALKSKRLA